MRFDANRFAIAALAVLAIAFTAGSASAQLYGCDRTGALFVVDCATGAGTFACAIPTQNGATEIECDPQSPMGDAVFQEPDGTFSIGGFNVNSCAPTTPVVFDGASFNGLEYVGATLYGTGILGPCSDPALYTVNPVTGATVFIGQTLHQRPISGLAYHAPSNTMYGVSGCNSAGPSDLVTVNLANGQATVVGSTGVTLGSCEFGCNGVLYAGGDTADGGNIYTINLASGAATLVGPSGSPQVTGLTTCEAPVSVEQESWGSVKDRYHE